MPEKKTTKIDFIGMSNKSRSGGERRKIELFMQIFDFPITTEELLDLKELQEEITEKLRSYFKTGKKDTQIVCTLAENQLCQKLKQ